MHTYMYVFDKPLPIITRDIANNVVPRPSLTALFAAVEKIVPQLQKKLLERPGYKATEHFSLWFYHTSLSSII